MGIIAALLMFHCNLHFNQQGCVDTHLRCIETMSTIKPGDVSTLNPDQRLAAAYLYCVETGGEVTSDVSYSRYLDMTHFIEDNYGNNSGFNVWEKPGYWEKIIKQMQAFKH